MELSSELISQFVKITNDTSRSSTTTTLYGTIVTYDGSQYVKLDGSDLLTPITSTASIDEDERVTVTIENHTATVTGNVTSPSASSTVVDGISSTVDDLDSEITEFGTVIAKKVDVEQLNAESARIDELQATNVVITGTLEAAEAEIDNLTAEQVTITERLTATEAEIDDLTVTKLDASVAEITYATIERLDATNAVIYNVQATYGDFELFTSNKLIAYDASIKDLEANKLSATDAELKYANIDFANIGTAAIETFLAKSGIISDLVVGDGYVTGSLVGVTIKGDLIEGGTVVAEKLVIKGEDGLFYKLNTDGVSLSTEQTEYNSLSGSVITAKSVTAEKVNVDDLVAFDATIGGFNITSDAIYSGAKTTAINTTRGIYMDDEGQMAFGDASNFVRFYKDAETGEYKLEITAESVKIGSSSTSVDTIIDELRDEIENVEVNVETTSLYIYSSNGNIFRNNDISTVLSVMIYHGTTRITDSGVMSTTFGEDAYLQWYCQHDNSDGAETLAASDSRLSNDGFALTLTSEDIDTKATFTCELIV